MSNKENIRLLAAVMFADIVGYTKMMQDDETKAKKLRDHQRKIVDDSILENHGQVMQYYGDGTLSMFGSALDAVNCAREIQLKLFNEQPNVPLRIGIHIGDVVYDDEGIYGDAVNISARVQSLGISGAVMISGKVFDEIKNHPGIRVEAFGEHELKNVYTPVRIYALADEGLEVPEQEYIHSITGSNRKSIAVLPFVNFSSNIENDYFSDGITEEIINTLARVEGLRVASRTSVFLYKNAQKDVREIGKDLNVATALEGSVRRSGSHVRVTAQLINTDDGFHIWSQNYDRELEDIFQVQDEIAKEIADKLEENFVIAENENLYEASTQNIEAYNYYLQGLFYWNKRTPEAIFKAIKLFNEAIFNCSTYTNAYSYLANCYTYLGTIGHISGNEAFEQAEKHANKAIELNNSRADSYIALGYVNLLFKWDFDQAEANFRKAITLEPDNSEGRQAYGFFNRVIGNYPKMIEQAKAAVKIDPLSLPALLELGRSYWAINENDKALEIFDKILELDPTFRSALEGKCMVYVNKEDYENALKEVKKYIKLIDGSNKGGSQLGYVYAKMGKIEKAKECLEKVSKREKEEKDINLTLDYALVYSAMRDYDRSFEYLNKAVDEKLGAVLLINSFPILDELRDDARFEQLIQRIGFPRPKMVAS
ncbi:MAG: tetratricopeptide repeat protein [Balneolaceae bacterium]|nr:tetratricopeptide repeat protein [Balneolaceae bacterium]